MKEGLPAGRGQPLLRLWPWASRLVSLGCLGSILVTHSGATAASLGVPNYPHFLQQSPHHAC